MSQEEKREQRGYEAYQENINIDLFNDVAAFVMRTGALDASRVRRDLEDCHLWYSSSHNDDIQEQYGFRYLGELLERFEEKSGSSIRNIRAIALAMACTATLLSDDMFVGGQKANFLRKITLLSEGDVYLKGALYLLNRFEPVGDAVLEELSQTTYARTEELIFAVSLYDDFAQAIKAFQPQLICLLGTGRTMTVYGNIRIYSWIIRNIYRFYAEKGMRSKELAPLRALMELPAAFVKAGNRYHEVLLDNGYTNEEILYLNSAILDFRPTPKTLSPHSVVVEKIAIEFCVTFINSEAALHSEVYEQLAKCLVYHSDFRVKINGNAGILDAIGPFIKISNPQTFIWLYKLTDEVRKLRIFTFDILDEKWDILSRELDSEEYCRLFEQQLKKNKDFDGAKMKKWIQRYDALTGSSYLLQFEKEYEGWHKNDMFALLVNKGIIDLIAAFKSCPGLDSCKPDDPDEARPPMLRYLGGYSEGANSREAFDFIKFLHKNYSIGDMFRWFADNSVPDPSRSMRWYLEAPFYDGSMNRTYYSERKAQFKLHRPFLSDNEHRELFGWLDDYMFMFGADRYVEFAVFMLLDPFVSSLFPQAELRRIYDMVRDLEDDWRTQDSLELKQKYLSESELQAEHDAAIARRQEAERQQREQQLQSLRDELAHAFDGSFKAILDFLSKHYHSFQNESLDAHTVAAGYIDKALSAKSFNLNTKELCQFMRLGEKLLGNEVISFAELKGHILNVEEDFEHAKDSGTLEFDFDDE